MDISSPPLEILPEVGEAIEAGRPVVGLESTVIAHGLPNPENLQTARRLEEVVREAGAVPATLGVAYGKIRIGLTDELLQRFADKKAVAKASRRDLGAVLASSGLGATTVAGSLICARLAGIRVLATGGIGGVHRGGQDSLDVSADLGTLADSPVAVVCAGAKGILDLPRTLEVLETLGVPVVGWGTDRLPAFWCRDSGLGLEHSVDGPEQAAALCRAHWSVGQRGGPLLVAPPPEASALPLDEVQTQIAIALSEASQKNIAGKRVTPFLLARLTELSGGRTLKANVALLENNARLAAGLAKALAAAAD